MRLLPTLLLTLCAALGLATAAQAASVTAENGALVIRGGDERNVITYGPSTEKPGLISVNDITEMQYDGSVCEPEFGEGFSSLACAPQPGGVVVEAGAGDDVVNGGELDAS